MLHSTLHRRSFLRGLASFGWLATVGHVLGQQERRNERPRSLIVLWLQGGPSQLETFDPHPGTAIAGGTRAIDTAVRGIQLAQGFDRLAEQMGSVALIRSMVTREGDHERGTYLLKTGHGPDPTVVHPAIGAVCCSEMPEARAEIPRHITILPSQWPAHGGFLGDAYDAFKMGDPANPVPDVIARVNGERDRRRLDDLDVIERAFSARRHVRAEETLHRQTVDRARRMMTSEQLRAFDVRQEAADLRAAYGDTPFGRGCLAARRLIEVGVRCVEVTLNGWDTHANNHSLQRARVDELDPAFAALIRDLRQREMLDRTVVLVAGEFGRTPRINSQSGRDHWPGAMSVLYSGGGLRMGQMIGTTDSRAEYPTSRAFGPQDCLATMYHVLGINVRHEFMDAGQRPIAILNQGVAIPELVG